MLLHERKQLIVGVGLDAHRVADVGTVKAAHEPGGLAQPQAIDDLRAGPPVRRRCKRHARDVRESVGEDVEAEVVLAEVVTPLRDAMRFVDREQGDVRALENA